MKTKIELIGIQPGIAGNINELYEKVFKRFVGLVLSTGGGKSFLAIDQILKRMNKYNNEDISFEETLSEDVLSNWSILYISSDRTINTQLIRNGLESIRTSSTKEFGRWNCVSDFIWKKEKTHIWKCGEWKFNSKWWYYK